MNKLFTKFKNLRNQIFRKSIYTQANLKCLDNKMCQKIWFVEREIIEELKKI